MINLINMNNQPNFVPRSHFLDPLHGRHPNQPILYSNKFVDGSIYDPNFIKQEKKLSADQITIVFDLDGTIRGWDEVRHQTFLRDNIKPLFESLLKKDYRLIIWSSAIRDSIQQTLNKYPDFAQYFDKIISLENYSFIFANDEDKKNLQMADKNYYDVMVKDVTNGVDPQTGKSLKRAPKNINLLDYALLIDDDILSLGEGEKFGFKCLRTFPYKFQNPGHKLNMPADFVNFVETDFHEHMLKRIVEAIEDRPVEDSGKIYIQEV